jgi:NADPH2 dehydrogenase
MIKELSKLSPKLFSSYKIKNVTFKNRMVMAPMCMYSSHEENGHVQDWHFTHYTSRAVGGVGLIITEATAVEPQGRISTLDLGIDTISFADERSGSKNRHSTGPRWS